METMQNWYQALKFGQTGGIGRKWYQWCAGVAKLVTRATNGKFG